MLGDWQPPPPHTATNQSLCSVAAFAIDVRNIAALASALGNIVDFNKYTKLYQSIGTNFHEAFYSPSIGGYADGSQTANLLALNINAVPANLVPTVRDSLVNNIKKNGNHLTTGSLGTSHFFPMLSVLGQHDLAIQVASQTTYPSFGYMYSNPNEQGTTLWEMWDADSHPNPSASRNHIMFGSIGAWFYRYVAGINPNSLDIVIISPYPVRNPSTSLKSVRATHQTIKGVIEVYWKITDKSYILEGKIPSNTKGKVIVPFLNSRYEQIVFNGFHVVDLEDLIEGNKIQINEKQIIVSSIELLNDGALEMMCVSGSFQIEAFFNN